MVVDILILFSWYPPAEQVPPFLGANSQQRCTQPSLQTFEYHHIAESPNNANQPLTLNFEPICFRAMPINQTEHYPYTFKEIKMFVFIFGNRNILIILECMNIY